MLKTNSNSLKHTGQGVGGGEQGTTVCRNKMSVAGLSHGPPFAVLVAKTSLRGRPLPQVPSGRGRTMEKETQTSEVHKHLALDPTGTCPL